MCQRQLAYTRVCTGKHRCAKDDVHDETRHRIVIAAENLFARLRLHARNTFDFYVLAADVSTEAGKATDNDLSMRHRTAETVDFYERLVIRPSRRVASRRVASLLTNLNVNSLTRRSSIPIRRNATFAPPSVVPIDSNGRIADQPRHK